MSGNYNRGPESMMTDNGQWTHVWLLLLADFVIDRNGFSLIPLPKIVLVLFTNHSKSDPSPSRPTDRHIIEIIEIETKTSLMEIASLGTGDICI